MIRRPPRSTPKPSSAASDVYKGQELTLPLVVRLEGTNVERGKAILNESGLAIEPAATMAEGAQKIVKLVKEA